MANIVRLNLANYRNRISKPADPDKPDKPSVDPRIMKILQRKIEKDLRRFSRVSFFVVVTIFIGIIQFLLLSSTTFIELNGITLSLEPRRLVEGGIIAISVIGLLIDLLGIMLVLLDKRQDPFIAIWPE